jgi:CRISPR-associated protein Cmr2
VQTARARANRRESLSFTQRPYLLDELAALLDACRLLKQARFPRSQLYQLRQIIEQGQLLQSVIDYHYYVGRGQRRSKAAAEVYTQFAVQVARLCGERAWLPWRIREQNGTEERTHIIYDTPLLDLIEITPFVPKDTSEEPARD